MPHAKIGVLDLETSGRLCESRLTNQLLSAEMVRHALCKTHAARESRCLQLRHEQLCMGSKEKVQEPTSVGFGFNIGTMNTIWGSLDSVQVPRTLLK